MFCYRDALGPVEIAFSDRHGGVSEGPWSSLNLGTSNGDDPTCVDANFGVLIDAFGGRPDRVVRISQVHGNDVVVANSVPGQIPVGDGLVTDAPELTLVVRVADCTPLVLADPQARVAGVAHVGREGLVRGVVESTVAALVDLGARSLVGWLGPRVCGDCYEVPEQMRDRVAAAVPAAWSTTSWGTPALDIGAGVRSRLDELGVTTVDAAAAANVCTIENESLFSYRRQGQQSGRSAGLVRIVA